VAVGSIFTQLSLTALQGLKESLRSTCGAPAPPLTEKAKHERTGAA